MPILEKEPDIFPENLLELPGHQQDQHWFAMYTLARHEKEFMRMLRPLKIAHYGPMVQQRKRSPAGRIRTSYVPLFTATSSSAAMKWHDTMPSQPAAFRDACR